MLANPVVVKLAVIGGANPMNGEYLRVTALRCLAVAQECSDDRLKQKLKKLAEDLLCKANEIDGKPALITTIEAAPTG